MFDNQDLVSPLPPGDDNLPDGMDGTPPLTGEVGDDFIWWVTNNLTGVTYGATTVQARAAFAPGTISPPAPRLFNIVDDAAGGSFQVEAVEGIPMTDYRYKVGTTGLPAQVPEDGIVSVGNVEGQVFVYSVASGNRKVSPPAATPRFSTAQQAPVVAFIAPVNGSTVVAGTTGLLRVSVTDPAGLTITAVRFYDGPTLLGNATPTSVTLWQMPYTFPATGSTLNLRVEAINDADGTGNSSCFLFLSPPVVPVVLPDAPTNLSADAGDNRVTLFWTASGNSGSGRVTSYYVYRNGNPVALGNTTGNTYLDTTAVNGQTYTYETATNSTVGVSPRSTPSNPVTPVAAVVPPSTGGNPSYHGATSSAAPNVSDVQALTAEQWAAGPRTIAYSCNGTFPTFAEPASNGVRSLILDKNNFNITADITRTTQLFSINGAAVSYNVYTHQNEQYDPNFIFNL